MPLYGVIMIGDFLEGEAEVVADTPLAAANATVADILQEEGDLTRIGKFWLLSEVVSLSEPGEDFQWLWDNDRADAATAAGDVGVFHALVDRGDVSDDDQWIDASVSSAPSATGANA